MTTKNILRNATAALVFGSVALFSTASSAGGNFNSVVEKVLMSQQEGPVAKMNDSKKRELVGCVNGVLAALPAGKKRFVTEAVSFDEMQDRFGKVVMENRAEWKQKIAKSCAKIAMA